MLTCKIGAESIAGLARNSTSGTGGCPAEQPTFIKFQPARLSFLFVFEFSVIITESAPIHINASNFGITAADITLSKTLVNRKCYNYPCLYIEGVVWTLFV